MASKEIRKTHPFYLEKVSTMDFIKEYKQLSYEMLDLKEGYKVLDLGCGTGDDVIVIAKIIGPHGKVIGVDINEEAIEASKEKAKDLNLPVEFRLGNGENLEFEDNFFDCVRSDRTFMHIVSPDKALKELVRVTKNGGRIWIGDPDWESLAFDSEKREITRKFVTYWSDKFINNGWMGRQLWGRLNEADLKIIQVQTIIMYTTSFQEANFLWSIESVLKRAISDGTLNENEVNEWLKELNAKDQAGTFFGYVPGFGIVAEK
ncbi:MAG: methyltransferase domain-containing protein [Candidatus Hermodarchaeota archaeon]